MEKLVKFLTWTFDLRSQVEILVEIFLPFVNIGFIAWVNHFFTFSDSLAQRERSQTVINLHFCRLVHEIFIYVSAEFMFLYILQEFIARTGVCFQQCFLNKKLSTAISISFWSGNPSLEHFAPSSMTSFWLKGLGSPDITLAITSAISNT